MKRRKGKKLRTDDRDMKILIKKIKKELPNFTDCRRCGECCGPLHISQKEYVDIIHELSRKELFPTVAKNLLREDYTERGEARFTCPLLWIENDPKVIEGRKTVCMVYRKRPVICRLQGIHPEMPCYFKSKKQKAIRDLRDIDRYRELVKNKHIELRPMIKEYINQWVIQHDITTGAIETVHVKARRADEKKPFTLCKDCLWDCYDEQLKGAIGCYDDEPHELIFKEKENGTGTEKGQS
jgi:hypothetical protein